jgi:hypothetical protein
VLNTDGEYALVFVPDLSQYPPSSGDPPDPRTVVVLGLTKYKKFTGKKDPLRNMEFQVVEGCCSNIKFPFPTQVSDDIPFHLQGSFFLVTTASVEALVGELSCTPGEAACGVFENVDWTKFDFILYPTLQVRATLPPLAE